MTLYRADICFNLGGNSELNVESLIIILFSPSLASLIPISLVSLQRLLWSSLTDTQSNNFGTRWGSVWSSNTTLRQSLEIGDWKTWGWRVIHVYRLRLIFSLILECLFRFAFLSKGYCTLSWIWVFILQPQNDVWLL